MRRTDHKNGTPSEARRPRLVKYGVYGVYSSFVCPANDFSAKKIWLLIVDCWIEYFLFQLLLC